MSHIHPQTKILITGAGGALGTTLTSFLKKRGFDNLLTPTRTTLDLLDREITKTYIAKHKPEIIIHLASVVFGLGGNQKNQMLALSNNTLMNDNLFSALEIHCPRKFFFAGTVASYPYPYPSLPLSENFFFNGLPHQGEFGYAMSKRHAYAYLEILKATRGMDYIYGLFTNLFGLHDNYDIETGHVIPSLIAKAHSASQTGTPLEVWGDGTAERDFLSFDEAAKAILFCIENYSETEPINISSGDSVTMQKVAETIASNFSISEISFDSARPTGIPKRIVCNRKLTKLGFKQSSSFEVALEKACAWYRSNSHS